MVALAAMIGDLVWSAPRHLLPKRSVDRNAAEEALERPLEPNVGAIQAGRYGAFVAAAVGGCVALLAGVLIFNVLVDPFSIAGTHLLPTAVEADRSIKLNLIQDLRQSPDIVILGSSRARQAEPAAVRRLTGHSGFNAAVTGGTAADAWVMARYITERFPRQRHLYIWFVDAGIATNGINPQLTQDPRAKRFLAGKSLHFTLQDVGTYIGTQATRASWRVVRKCLFSTCRTRLVYRPDGSIARTTLKYLPEHARSLKRSVARLVAAVRAHPLRRANVSPARYVFFERTIAFMNAHGSTPVIVLNPIHPEVLAALRRQGFLKRRASLRYLRALHRRLRFVVVDAEDIHRWGGSARDWTNATHVNRVNMRRLLRYIVAHSKGVPD
jgi:hypothetical protein